MEKGWKSRENGGSSNPVVQLRGDGQTQTRLVAIEKEKCHGFGTHFSEEPTNQSEFASAENRRTH